MLACCMSIDNTVYDLRYYANTCYKVLLITTIHLIRLFIQDKHPFYTCYRET